MNIKQSIRIETIGTGNKENEVIMGNEVYSLHTFEAFINPSQQKYKRNKILPNTGLTKDPVLNIFIKRNKFCK